MLRAYWRTSHGAWSRMLLMYLGPLFAEVAPMNPGVSAARMQSISIPGSIPSLQVPGTDVIRPPYSIWALLTQTAHPP